MFVSFALGEHHLRCSTNYWILCRSRSLTRTCSNRLMSYWTIRQTNQLVGVAQIAFRSNLGCRIHCRWCLVGFVPCRWLVDCSLHHCTNWVFTFVGCFSRRSCAWFDYTSQTLFSSLDGSLNRIGSFVTVRVFIGLLPRLFIGPGLSLSPRRQGLALRIQVQIGLVNISVAPVVGINVLAFRWPFTTRRRCCMLVWEGFILDVFPTLDALFLFFGLRAAAFLVFR